MFFLAMALHPDAQSRVQREIDSVVGMGRLPDFGDERSLPYVSAVVEVTRWYTVARPRQSVRITLHPSPR